MYPDILNSATFSSGFKNFPMHTLSIVIGFVADLLFSTLESGFKNMRISRTEALYAEKKLRIQKYPDTRERGLKKILFEIVAVHIQH